MQISSELLSVESEFTVEQIETEAYQGRYYNIEAHQWKSIGYLEWIFRNLLGILNFIDTPFQSCLRKSWKSIDTMDLLPIEIEQKIVEIFNASRERKSPLSPASPSITKIYTKILQKKGARHFKVMQDDEKRLFRVFENGDVKTTIISTNYGILDFYNKDKINIITNKFDSLIQNDSNSTIAEIKITNNWQEKYKIEIFTSTKGFTASLCPEGDDHSFVFRDAVTHKILALAVWESLPWGRFYSGLNQKWSVTVLDEEALHQIDMTTDILAWSLLKHSQQYLLGPNDLPYVEVMRL